MKSIFTCITLGLLFNFQAQDVRDLVRFSETKVYGSARFESMGGAFGALGADLSSAAINPAGYGRYSSAVFGFGFQNTSILNRATFANTETNNSLNSFKMNNLGFVLTTDVSERNSGFIFKQIGVSYNRIQDFKDEFNYTGQQYSSLLDHFASMANQLEPNEIYDNLPFSSALAWDTYAIDPDGNGGYYPTLSNADVIHRRKVSTKGGISEYNVTISGNYMNKLYIGGNLGYRSAKYEENYQHAEFSTNSEGFSLDSFQYQYHLKTKGNGTNLKLGVIYLPIQSLRLGLSFHTPTFFEFDDDFDADMVSYHKDTTYRIDKDFVPVGFYKYRLRTPTRLIASAAYVFQTRGCISGDFELVNYKWAHLKSTKDVEYQPFDYSEINDEAKLQTRTVLNIRLGGELVFNSQYFIRGGFALFPSAYSQNSNVVNGTKVFTGGLGFKWSKHALDLALKIEHRNYDYYAFPESLTQVRSFRNGIILNYSISF